MPAPLSNDLRKRMIEAMIDNGLSAKATAKHYGVALSSAIKLKRHYLKYNTYKPLKVGGFKKHKLSNFDKILRDFLTSSKDSTLFELCYFFNNQGVNISFMSIYRYLKKIGYSLKKRQFMPESNCEKKLFIEESNGKNIKKI